MSTVYVASSREAAWHILRPNEHRLVWCQAEPHDATWTYTSLQLPASVCPTCRDAEAASLAADLGRVPGLSSIS